MIDSHRRPRTRVFALPLFLLLALMVGLACTTPAPPQEPAKATAAPDKPSAKTATTPAPKADPKAAGPEGSVTVAISPLATSTDPGSAGAGGFRLQFYWPGWDGLTWVDREGELQPGLAESWETEDGQTWTFTLGDWQFHDGSAVVAEDVVGTFNYYKDPENRLPAASIFPVGTTVEATDDKTVVISLPEPRAAFAKLVSLAMILKARDLDPSNEAALEAFLEEPMGTGPYRFVSFEPKLSFEYEAMPADFESPRGTAPVQRLVFRDVAEVAARFAALQTGEVQIADRISSDLARELEGDDELEAMEERVTSTVHFVLNTYDGPTAEVDVRRALNYGVDKEGIIENFLGGYGEADGQALGSNAFGYNPDVEPYPYDPDQARELLASAGFADGFESTLQYYPAFLGQEVEAIQAQLAEIGVQVELQSLEQAQFLEGFYGPPDSRAMLWSAGVNYEQTFEADSAFRWFSSDFPIDGGRRWDHPEFDELYQEAKGTLDESERDRLYQEAGRILNEDAAVLFLWRNNRPIGVNTSIIDWTPGIYADAYVGQLSLK